MLEFTRFRRALFAGLVSLAISVAACDTGGSGAMDTDKQAGLDNVDAMSGEHANDTSEPSEVAKVAPTRAVDSETLPYADVNDELAFGYLAYPSGVVEPLPAIVMIHE